MVVETDGRYRLNALLKPPSSLHHQVTVQGLGPDNILMAATR